jgi:hypothetical protein
LCRTRTWIHAAVGACDTGTPATSATVSTTLFKNLLFMMVPFLNGKRINFVALPLLHDARLVARIGGCLFCEAGAKFDPTAAQAI